MKLVAIKFLCGAHLHRVDIPQPMMKKRNRHVGACRTQTRLCVLGVLLAWFAVAPTALAQGQGQRQRQTSKSQDEVVRIMSYNIRHADLADGVGGDTANAADISALAAMISTHAPEVVVLQEVDRNGARSAFVDQALLLGIFLGMHAHFELATYLSFADRDDPSEGEAGIAVLSVYPLSSIESFTLPTPYDAQRRKLLVAGMELDNGQTLYVGTSHVSTGSSPNPPTGTGDNRIARELQVRVIAETMAGRVPFVLLGDFNERVTTGSDGDAAEMLSSAFLDLGASPYPAAANTFPASNPNRRIDYAFAAEASCLTPMGGVQTVASTLSDHRPIYVDVTVHPGSCSSSTCANACGGISANGSCSCAANCHQQNNCCKDKVLFCSSGSGCPASAEATCADVGAECVQIPGGPPACTWTDLTTPAACDETPGIWTPPHDNYAIAHPYVSGSVGSCVTETPNIANSCKGQCGGIAGSCFCDQACHTHGDCCDDKQTWCSGATCSAEAEAICGYWGGHCKVLAAGPEACIWPYERTENDCIHTTPGIWTTANSSYAAAHPFLVTGSGLCITEVNNLRCTSSDRNLCVQAGGEFCVLEKAYGGFTTVSHPLCKFAAATAGQCSATPGIWTEPVTRFGERHPLSLPFYEPACITQVPNLR